MTADTKVLLLKLYARRSQRGNECLIGRLGAATVIAFKDDRAELKEGTLAVWNLYVQEPTDNGQRRPAIEAGQDRQASAPISHQARRPTSRRTFATREPASSTTSDLPDDAVADLWPAGQVGTP
jgi:hypothetical protein